jgi:hypothetical protein
MTKVQVTYNPNGSMKWSQRQADIVKAKFLRGRTQAQIADECTTEWGVKITKGMVVGKLNQLGLHRPPRGLDPGQQGGGAQKKPKRQYVSTTSFQGGIAPEDHAGIGTIEKSLHAFFNGAKVDGLIPFAKISHRTCKWPFETPSGATMYCGNRCRENKPYCEPHWMLARGVGMTHEQKMEVHSRVRGKYELFTCT